MKNNLFLIAEIGINHNGDINLAKEMIDDAYKADFDAVKFQKRTIDLVYDKKFLDSYRESPWGSTQREQKNGLEFSISQFKELRDFSHERGLKFSASCWDTNAFYEMIEVGLDFHKIASPMNRHYELLELIANTKMKTFISTGMSSLEEISKAVNIFKEKNCDFELMHCVSCYPMNEEEANLLCIPYLSKKFDCKVGYSGHETSLTRICCAAVALGATSVERHITVNRAMYGSDQAASIETHALKKFTSSVRIINIALGDGKKKLTDSEKESRLKLSSNYK